MSWMATSPLRGPGIKHAAESSGASRRLAASSRLRPGLKRGFDVLAAVLLLAAVMPLFLLIALAIKLDSRGPVFYRVRRVGYRGRPLMMLKFRKMQDNATGIPLTANADTRLTRVGRILVRTRLDELPQLWDVLRGRMSIVGPRPEDPSFVQLHPEAFDRILSVRPGMTGLSQLAFVEERNILDHRDLIRDYTKRILPQKIHMDTLYADCHRLGMDLAVLRWTFVAVLLRRPVAVHRETGRMNVRRRPRTIVHVVDERPIAEPALSR
jgi:lipopolysaccharide/colanic/teichoic acid biosynthesis glycosyltransferase